MFNTPPPRNDPRELARKLARAKGMSAALFAEIFAASSRLMLLRSLGKTRRLDQLVGSEAWCDAALELLSLEAPGWGVQRLWQAEGEWLCSLSRFHDLPDWLDDCAEASHPVMPLAILGAVLELRERPTELPVQNGRALVLGDHVVDAADYR